MKIDRDSEGVDYVAVSDLWAWLKRLEDAIEAECAGAPDNCTETKAYLYGEICSLRLIRKQVEGWKSKPKSEDA